MHVIGSQPLLYTKHFVLPFQRPWLAQHSELLKYEKTTALHRSHFFSLLLGAKGLLVGVAWVGQTWLI